jgi:hypothetical protein
MSSTIDSKTLETLAQHGVVVGELLPPGAPPPKRKGGRPKGSVNKVTARVRNMVADVLDSKAPEIIDWISRVALYEPAQAARLYLDLMEFAVPKLARTELTAEVRGKLGHYVAVETREEPPTDAIPRL